MKLVLTQDIIIFRRFRGICLIFASFTIGSYCIDLKCNYVVDSYIIVFDNNTNQSFRTCKLENIYISEDQPVNFDYDLRNEDVQALKINVSMANFIPNEIYTTFPRLEALMIRDVKNFDLLKPEYFQGAHNLKHFWCYLTNIEVVKAGTFDEVPSLEKIYMSRNKIQFLEPGCLRNLPNLRLFHMYKNQIKFILAGVFDNVESLYEIHLDDNLIQKIDPTAFYGLPQLQVLDLQRNPCVDERFSTQNGTITSAVQMYRWNLLLRTCFNDNFRFWLTLAHIMLLFSWKLIFYKYVNM